MRKTLASRIIVLAVIYIAAFFLIVMLQFSNSGNFSISAGGMSIKGRYKQTSQPDISLRPGFSPVTGGVKIFYEGLEFGLIEERGEGLSLIDIDGNVILVNPDYMLHINDLARFILPGGTILTFNSGGSELQISGEIAADITEVLIPVVPRRSSVIRDAGQIAVLYSGLRYTFDNIGEEFDSGFISLTRGNSPISYYIRNRQTEFNPLNFAFDHVSDYDNVIRSWADTSFSRWNQNAASLQNEDDVIAYLAESLTRGNYNTALQNIPAGFLNSARQSYKSSAFIGGMTNAYRSFIAAENERMNLISRLIRERSPDILKEERVLNWLHTRNNAALANEVISIVNNIDPESLTIDHLAGILEIYSDVRRWQPDIVNPAQRFTENIVKTISENLNRNTDNNRIFIAGSSEGGGFNYEYNARLGTALSAWAQTLINDENFNAGAEWAAVGRSLVLSALSEGNAGALYNVLKPSGFYPRAEWISNEGHWAWTVSQSIRASYTGSDLILAITFPVNMTHHILIRGIRPFSSIQIHGQAWRTDSQFERYDSSGWVYYQDEQVLVLKLRHRAALESVRIVY